MKQLKFKGIPKPFSEFGGSLLVNKRKGKRPLSFKSPQHVVFKSETVDKTTSFVKYKSGIQKIISKTAKEFGVKIYNTSINFNHIHNAFLFSSREQYNTFVRVVIARIVAFLETKTGKSLKGLFNLRPYTRIVSWGRDFSRLLKYIVANTFEAEGVDVWGRYGRKKTITRSVSPFKKE